MINNLNNPNNRFNTYDWRKVIIKPEKFLKYTATNFSEIHFLNYHPSLFFTYVKSDSTSNFRHTKYIFRRNRIRYQETCAVPRPSGVPRGLSEIIMRAGYVCKSRGKMVFARLSPPRATNLPVVAWPVPSSASPPRLPSSSLLNLRRGLLASFYPLSSFQRAKTYAEPWLPHETMPFYALKHTRTTPEVMVPKRSTQDNYYS